MQGETNITARVAIHCTDITPTQGPWRTGWIQQSLQRCVLDTCLAERRDEEKKPSPVLDRKWLALLVYITNFDCEHVNGGSRKSLPAEPSYCILMMHSARMITKSRVQLFHIESSRL